MQHPPQEFEKLRQLLALKRHENPPPGYFGGFSRTVIERIDAEHARLGTGLLARLGALFQERPAISWSFAVAGVLVLFASSNLFESEPIGKAPGLPRVDNALAAGVGEPVPATAAGMFFGTNLEPLGFAFDVKPATSTSNAPLGSLFNTPFYQRVEPVSFSR